MPNIHKNSDTDSLQVWRQNARETLKRRDFAATERLCQNLINADPRNPDAHFFLAMVALETNQVMPALKLLQRAIAFNGDVAEYHAQLGRVLVMLQKTNPAYEAASRALQLNPEDPVTLDTIGCIYSHAGNHEQAIQVFSKAVTRAQSNPDLLYNLASSQRFQGAFGAAEKNYEQAIAADPLYYKAHWSLAYLKRQTPEHNHIQRLRQLMPKMLSDDNATAFLNNALAKEYDDLGDIDSAFKYLSEGKRIVRKRINYSTNEDKEIFDKVTQLFSPATASQKLAGHQTSEPIFIVGMPRTGTTLVERILSSHSDVFSAGELRNFALELKRATATPSPKILDCETLEKGMSIDPEVLGKSYLDSTRPATGHAKHFIDKTPLNFLNIGFIRRALPNAKIVCLRRNPMDTCLSNFRQMFSPDSSPYYKYSFDLLETGAYYLLFDKLMDHWATIFPERILQIQYEEVVANQEEQSRRLIEFCDLEWQDACLNFEKNSAPVATASSVQVRQPIYTDATARWKRYAQHLEPLRQFFAKSGLNI